MFKAEENRTAHSAWQLEGSVSHLNADAASNGDAGHAARGSGEILGNGNGRNTLIRCLP